MQVTIMNKDKTTDTLLKSEHQADMLELTLDNGTVLRLTENLSGILEVLKIPSINFPDDGLLVFPHSDCSIEVT